MTRCRGGIIPVSWPKHMILKMMPGVLLGFWLSRRLEKVVQKDSARPAILRISALSALVVLWQGVTGGLNG